MLAGTGFRDAQAGNINVVIPAASVQYFSLELSMGQSVKYTGSIANTVWLIDDITYAVDLDPCNTEDRCVMFDISMIRSCWDPIIEPDPNAHGWHQYPGLCDPHQVIEFSDWPGLNDYFRDYTITRWARARATNFRAGLSNGPAGQVYGPYFDRVSHTMYGQLLARQVQSDGVKTIGEGEIMETQRGTAYGIGLGLGITAVQTSESRHYQTPEIIQAGNNPPTTGDRLIFHEGDGCSGNSAYTCAFAMVKGRLITNTTYVPVHNYTDFTTYGP
jgi:hypothetical protein